MITYDVDAGRGKSVVHGADELLVLGLYQTAEDVQPVEHRPTGQLSVSVLQSAKQSTNQPTKQSINQSVIYTLYQLE